MDSPQKKAPASMDGSKAPHLLPVTLPLAKKTPGPDLVRRVSSWALLTACHIALSLAIGTVIAYALDHFHVRCSQSFFLRCDQLTGAEEAVVNALGIRLLCCLALQAAAAVLALRLPCRRRRRALAYLALVLTIVGHFIMAAIAHILILLVADPGDLFFRICYTGGLLVYAAGDIISFLALLLGGEE